MKIINRTSPQTSAAPFKGAVVLAALVAILTLIPIRAYCENVTLAWDANPEHDLKGYILYYGTSSGNYTSDIDVGNVTQYTIPELQNGETYYFAVTAYNEADYESDYSVELPYTVGNPNSNPTTPTKPNSPSSGYINVSYTFNTSASDPDDDPLEYKYDWGDGSQSSWGASSRSHAWTSAGTYCIKAQAQDSHGALSGWSVCHNITIDVPSYTITAAAGANGSISPSGSVTVSHGSDKTFSVSADPNYQVLAVWIDGNSHGAITTYTFKNITKAHTISASFVSSNQKPNANAGSDQTVTEGHTVSLNGNNSSDPGGSIVSYKWQQIDGLSVQLSNSNSKKATFTAPDVGIAGATLAFRLTVTDDGGLTDTDTCTVEVTKDVVVDSDGDGVPDNQDDFPMDPDEYLDTDGDGEGNNADSDDDNDGMPDDWELTYGLDPLKNDADSDLDGDDVSNINEFNLGTVPNHHEGNFEPDKPVLLSPENGETVSLMPVLRADEFNDPNINDTHSKTQWVILRAFDDFCVLDVTTEASLTSLKVPNQILEENSEYIWKTRYIDNHDTASEWSEEKEFVTDLADHDLDKDGVPDLQEVTDTLDLDEDGIVDVHQNDLKCVSLDSGKSQICVSIRDAENAVSIESLEAQDPDDPELGFQNEGKPNYFEFGLLDFKIIVDQPGDETVVTIYLSKPAFKHGNCFKYDPVNDAWFDYSEFTQFSPNRKEVYLTLKDGGFGDADGIENGIIVDPLAFGSESDPNGGGSDDTPIEDVLDGLGCFITTAAAQSDSRETWNLWQEIRGREPAILLVAILLVLGAKAALGRRRAEW